MRASGALLIGVAVVAAPFAVSIPVPAGKAAGGTTVALAVDGKVNATIVVPKGSEVLPCNGVFQAAHELAHYVSLMAGCPEPLPVVVDDGYADTNISEAAGNLVFVGDVSWALAAAGFNTSTLEQEGIAAFAYNSSWLFVVGRSDGKDGDRRECGSDWSGRNDTLHATYTLLQSLGVYWLGPYGGGDVVPSRTTVVAPVAGKPLMQAPALLKRQIRKIYNTPASYPNVPWLNQTVFNMLSSQETRWLQRMRLGQHDTPPWGQAFSTWWKRYGASHPEYFALNPDGKRGPLSASKPDRVKMCVSNPDLWEAVASGGTNHNPFGLSAAEDDSNWGFCQCDKCKAWDAISRANSSTGKYSDRYARFWSNIAKLLTKSSPTEGTHWVTAYGYDSYRDPPSEVQLEGSIMIGYVGFDYPALPNETALEHSRWTGWTAAGAKKLFLRPNSLITGQGLPYVFSKQLAMDFQYTAQHGLAATDFDSLMNHWGAVGPTYYVLARLHWQPATNHEDILTEFYSGFGTAAAPMRAYQNWVERWTYDTFTSTAARLLVSNVGNSSGWFPNVRRLFTADMLQHATSLVRDVANSCASDICRTRVELVSIAVEHARLTMTAFNATASAGDCYGPCLGGHECHFGNNSVPCLPTAGANSSVLGRIVGASNNLTKYRIQIAALNAVNVYWAENAERVAASYFPGRDYNGAGVAADVARVQHPWTAHSLLQSVDWSFTLDPSNIGLSQNWSQPSSVASWNSTAILSSKGWCCGRVPAVSNYGHSEYTGVGWYRVSFDCKDCFHGTGTRSVRWPVSAIFMGANGSASVWVNGVPATMHRSARPTSGTGVAAEESGDTGGGPFVWQFEKGSLRSRNNVLIVRLDARGKRGAGLTGRVFIARSTIDR